MAKKKKYRLKKKFKRMIRRMFFFLVFVVLLIILFKFFIKFSVIDSISIKDNKINVLLKDDVYCIMSSDEPDLNDKNWVKSVDKICVLDYEFGINHLYIKNDNKII